MLVHAREVLLAPRLRPLQVELRRAYRALVRVLEPPRRRSVVDRDANRAGRAPWHCGEPVVQVRGVIRVVRVLRIVRILELEPHCVQGKA